LTREEKSRLWHLLIEKIEARKNLISVYWRGNRKYTFRRDRLARILNGICTKGRCVVAAGGFEPSIDANSQLFADLERFLLPQELHRGQ